MFHKIKGKRELAKYREWIPPKDYIVDLGDGIVKVGDGVRRTGELPQKYRTKRHGYSIQLRRGLEQRWKDHDPILENGEVVMVDCGNTIFGKRIVKFKVGDGISRFSELPYCKNLYHSS